MGKIIKDGFDFMRRVNSHLIRELDDAPGLRRELIELAGQKSHLQLSNYALALAEHILQAGWLPRLPEFDECFEITKKWQQKQARFQEALVVAGRFNDLARAEKDAARCKALRAMGQVAATPHMRWHSLAASEYAVAVVNLLWPKDFERAKQERELQLTLLRSVCG